MEKVVKSALFIGIGFLIAYSTFIVWYSVQVFKQSKITAQASVQSIQYINAGIGAGFFPTIEQINEKLAPKK